MAAGEVVVLGGGSTGEACVSALRELEPETRITLVERERITVLPGQPTVFQGLIDSFREAGFGLGLTYPLRFGSSELPPFLRIDYVWHTRELRAVDAHVMPDTGSDHLPVWVELNW